MEGEEIEARGTFPYGKSIEVRTMWEKLSDGMNRNGISDHVGWVKTGRPEVSDKKREGWIRVDALIDMFNLVSRIHEIERRNRERAGEEAKELERLEAKFAPITTPRKYLDERGLG
jgi:hypothetical protein